MRVFISPPPANDRGIARVSMALEKHSPGNVRIVKDEDGADLVVLHAIGRADGFERRVRGIVGRGKKYVMIQYAVRSTKNPNTKRWIDMWNGASLVWSYYDLRSLCLEDGICSGFQFYHSPLGTDFSTPKRRSQYIIATSGLSYHTESVRECHKASLEVGGRIFHVGPSVGRRIECSNGMSDTRLAEKYSQCAYVSGLRRIEGFEFPVIEGFMCGARPVVFDRPHYRSWFSEFAEFIPELPRPDVLVSLKKLFTKDTVPVSSEEQDAFRDRFDWGRIIRGFYAHL
jgi:hypothetical protein